MAPPRAACEGVVLAAGDDGARAALAPLEPAGARFGASLESARALVAGTSQSAAGFRMEVQARREAARRVMPVVCIEDFPGNYRDVEGAPTRLLVVEGKFCSALYRERLGAKAPPMAVLPPARYDALRTRARNPGSAGPPWRVLWAGQPETDACLATLRGIAPFLRSSEVELLFRAHPRDAGHPRAYEELSLRFTDVTALPLEDLYRAPLDLVVTQFSSIAVEAGFLGVPSVHVLFPEAGAKLLEAQKGYRLPMACEFGAAFHVGSPQSLDVLEQALHDTPARRAVISRFRELYRADTPQAAKLARHLAGIIA
ncbi:MAG: hypothetical protein AB1452_17245 [Pseudomonadota bacterium]